VWERLRGQVGRVLGVLKDIWDQKQDSLLRGSKGARKPIKLNGKAKGLEKNSGGKTHKWSTQKARGRFRCNAPNEDETRRAYEGNTKGLSNHELEHASKRHNGKGSRLTERESLS